MELFSCESPKTNEMPAQLDRARGGKGKISFSYVFFASFEFPFGTFKSKG